MRYAMRALVFSLFVLSAQTYAAEDRSEVPEVMMNQYLVASANQYPAIQTYGVATCIAVILYGRHNQTGALMHVSVSTNISEALKLVLNEMEQRTGAVQLEATLLGGWADSMGADSGMTYESDRMVDELVRELRKENVLIVENSTLLEKDDAQAGRSAILNLELDLATGQVFHYEQTIPFSGGEIASPMPENPL